MLKYGHTIKEYNKNFGEDYKNGELWDFSMQDVLEGAIEIDPAQEYWVINGRVYETGREE